MFFIVRLFTNKEDLFIMYYLFIIIYSVQGPRFNLSQLLLWFTRSYILSHYW